MKKIATAPETLPVDIVTPTGSRAKGYWEVKIPRLNLQNTGTNAYLVFSLVILAFFLGMLTNKVMYLEQSAKTPQANTAANAAVAQPTIPEPPQVVTVDAGALPVRGDKNAKITIVEFSDFQCPFCKQYIDQVDSQIQEKYVKTGKVKFAYRHYPLTQIHPNAQLAAEASECAQEQDGFWKYHDLLFQNQDTWSPQSGTTVIDSFVDYAGQAGLDADQFRSCVESHKYKANVDKDAAIGSSIQVDGTPAFFVNGYRMTGAQPFSAFEQVIEEELKK